VVSPTSTTTPPTEASQRQPTLYPIVCDDDVVQFRHLVRRAAVAAGLRLIDQTKLVTAASELARNALEHGGGGLGEICLPETVGRTGVRLIVEDDGPGIPDIELALTDGFSRAVGMGMGLPGTRRLVDAFEIWSEVGVGTCVTVEKWAL
jgi:serine/threonine-protein kinase RsbT